jgi:hypothetical protein
METRRVLMHSRFGLCAVLRELDMGEVEAQPLQLDLLRYIVNNHKAASSLRISMNDVIKAQSNDPDIQRMLDLLEEEVPGVAWYKVEHQRGTTQALITGALSVNGEVAYIKLPVSLLWLANQEFTDDVRRAVIGQVVGSISCEVGDHLVTGGIK